MISGNRDEISSLRVEHTGELGIILIIYAIQVYIREEYEDRQIKIWIDNTEVLSQMRGGGICVPG